MKKIYLFFCLLIIGSALQAQTKTWVGGADSMWHTDANWSPSGVPTSSDSVVFNNTTSVDRIYFNNGATASARVINLAGANVIFAIKGGSGFVSTLNLGGTVSADYNLNALRFTGASANSLTLNAMRTAGANSGIIVKVLANNRAIVPAGKTIHIGGIGVPSQDSVSSTQVNQLKGSDSASWVIRGTINVQTRNNTTAGLTPFGSGSDTAQLNQVVFESGSVLNNNTGSASSAINLVNPFATAWGPGIAQFLRGSTFNVSSNSSVPIGQQTQGFNAMYVMGRTYGTLNITKLRHTSNTVYSNTSPVTTKFLDALVINTDTTFLITLTTGNNEIELDTTYSFNNIRIRNNMRSPSTLLAFRANNTALYTKPLNVSIYGNVNLETSPSNTTGGSLALTFGPNATSATAPSNLNFTGNTTVKVDRSANGSTNLNPNFLMGASTTSTTPVNITVHNGATLAMGDSLDLKSNGSLTFPGSHGSSNSTNVSLTIKPRGTISFIDNANLYTRHNSNFKVESDTTGTGTIGTVTGALYNSAVIQRFIGRNAAWRTIGIPLSAAAPTQFFGGNGTSTSFKVYMNSFTASPAQAYYFNDTLDNGQYGAGSGGANAGWRSFTTNNDSIPSYKGLLLYGSRNSASPIVLSLTGFLNYADQTIPLSKTASGNGWNLIANPFLSNISFNSIVSNPANDGVLNSNTIYRVRPLGAGAYSFASYVAGSGTGTNGGSNVIENGAAFFVRAANAGTSLVIRGSDKTIDAVGSTTGGVTLMGANDNYNSIRVSLKGANTFTDEVVFVWGRFSKATEAFDNDLDAYDLGASGTHDLSIVDKEGTRYAIFNGADLPKDAETRTYKLATKNLRLGTYSFEVSMPKALDRNNEAYLVDNYLGTAVLVKEGLSHSFQVTADAASKAEGRFQLEIRKKLTSAIDEVATSKTYLLSNPTRNNQFAIHFGSDAQVANWQVVDLSGRVIGTGMFKNVYQGDTRIGELKTLQPGTYLVRLFNGNEPTVVMKLVKL